METKRDRKKEKILRHLRKKYPGTHYITVEWGAYRIFDEPSPFLYGLLIHTNTVPDVVYLFKTSRNCKNLIKLYNVFMDNE